MKRQAATRKASTRKRARSGGSSEKPAEKKTRRRKSAAHKKPQSWLLSTLAGLKHTNKARSTRQLRSATALANVRHRVAALATIAMMVLLEPMPAFGAGPPGGGGFSPAAAGGGGFGGAGGGGGGGGGGAETFRDMSQNVINASGSFNGLISTVCWLGGAGLGVTAIYKLKQHVDSGGTTPMKDGLVRLGAAGGLLALPFMMSAMQGSISDGNLTKVAALQLQMDSATMFK